MNKVNEAGYNESTKFGPSENNPPYISDDFQIGPDGAYEHNEDITPKETTLEIMHELLFNSSNYADNQDYIDNYESDEKYGELEFVENFITKYTKNKLN